MLGPASDGPAVSVGLLVEAPERSRQRRLRWLGAAAALALHAGLLLVFYASGGSLSAPSLRQRFDAYDGDGDGRITTDDARQLLLDSDVCCPTPEAAAEAVAEMDSDVDGHVEWGEFKLSLDRPVTVAKPATRAADSGGADERTDVPSAGEALAWGQCGGRRPTDTRPCADGALCIVRNERTNFSQCVPSWLARWTGGRVADPPQTAPVAAGGNHRLRGGAADVSSSNPQRDPSMNAPGDSAGGQAGADEPPRRATPSGPLDIGGAPATYDDPDFAALGTTHGDPARFPRWLLLVMTAVVMPVALLAGRHRVMELVGEGTAGLGRAGAPEIGDWCRLVQTRAPSPGLAGTTSPPRRRSDR